MAMYRMKEVWCKRFSAILAYILAEIEEKPERVAIISEKQALLEHPQKRRQKQSGQEFLPALLPHWP